jgi:hypothetical protein
VPASKLKEKKCEKIFFWHSLKKGVESELDLNPDPLVIGTDPRIRIRNKMLRIPNTGRVVGMNQLRRTTNILAIS